MRNKGVTFQTWERLGYHSLFMLSASLRLSRVDGEFSGLSRRTLLTCEIAKNKLLVDVIALSRGTALGRAVQSLTRIPSFNFEEI